MMSPTPIRVLLGKVGLDLHDVGTKYVARGLREAGMEVIYLGPFQTAESIVVAATSEDPDVVAISNISGEYLSYMPEIVHLLRDSGLEPLVVLGGLVPEGDHEKLTRIGVDAVFGQGSKVEDIVKYIRDAVAVRAAAQRG